MPVPQQRKFVPARQSHSLVGLRVHGPQRQSLAQTCSEHESQAESSRSPGSQEPMSVQAP